MHPAPYEHRGSNESNKDNLHGLEDVDKCILLHKKPLLVKTSSEHLHFRDRVPREDECCSVAAEPVKREGQLIVDPHPDMETPEAIREFTDGDVSIGSGSISPILLLILHRRYLPLVQCKMKCLL